MTTVTIIIPVKPGGQVAALAALHALDAPPDSFEILVAEGNSPSRQRNSAAREAQGEIIYFLDDDSRVAPSALGTINDILADPAVAAVGGPSLTPEDDTLLQQLFGSALASLLGAGAVRNRYRAVGAIRETTDRELILCNLAMRREVFLEFGGFDERLYPNEENELMDRIIAKGLKLIHAPGMAIRRSQRRTLRQFCRQMFSYGRGRAQQTLISGQIAPVSFAPLLFLLYLLLLPFLPLTPLSVAPLAAYLLLAAVSSVMEALAAGSPSRLLLLLLFPIMHIANGYGLLRGLFGGKQGISAARPDMPVTVRRVKEFGQAAW